MKALATMPEERYRTVEEFRADLNLFLEGRSVSAKQDTMRELAVKLVKRNKGVSIAMGAALMVLIVVATFFLRVNYDARVRAETERNKANENYAAFQKEQEQRVKQGRDSIPSLLTAAELLVEKRDFDAARAQVRIGLDFYPEHTELRKLRGQLALIAQDFGQAQKDLAAHARQRPEDLLTRELVEWLPRAKANDNSSQIVLAAIFTRHQAFALADGALISQGDNAQTVRQKLLTLYQQRIDNGWPGKKYNLTLVKGSFQLALGGSNVTNLAPLRGLPLSSLNLAYCHQVQDLEPLRGMPLTSLILTACVQVQDLGPLRGMPLTSLNLDSCSEVRDLGSLKGLPLTSLNLRSCPVRDLGPLQGMPLTSLSLDSCGKVRDLDPLRGMPLKTLMIYGSKVTDLRPLQGMQLEDLRLTPRSITQGLDILRRMETLKTIGINYEESGAWPAAEFWKKHKAGEFK